MSISDIVKALESVKVPVARDHYESEQGYPYIVYAVNPVTAEAADNSAYLHKSAVQVDLYTAERNDYLMMAAEMALDTLGTAYAESSLYVENERCFVTTFTFETLLEV